LHCCGVPIAWAAFPFSESDPNIVQFMTSIWSDWLSGGPARPSYLVIDKACRILRHLINAANGLWQVWFQTTRFKVDGFHWRNHRTNDQLCQVWCNVRDPADPQLMRRVVDGQGVEQMVSAFNSEVSLDGMAMQHVLKRLAVTGADARMACGLRIRDEADGIDVLSLVRARRAALAVNVRPGGKAWSVGGARRR
jgi:hypothetical protein